MIEGPLEEEQVTSIVNWLHGISQVPLERDHVVR